MVYLDGRYLPLAEAKVSVLDRGFLFGDGIYEVIPVYSRRPFRLAEHLARLDASLAGIRMANPHSAAEWAELIAGLVAQHLTTRPTQDLDFFTRVGGTGVPAARDALEAAAKKA